MNTPKIIDLVKPGTQVAHLSKPQLREIFVAAQNDTGWLSNLYPASRKDVAKSIRRGETQSSIWRVALIALNSVTADAALAGTYNEWDSIKSEVLDYSEQPRPFFAALRTLALLDIEPVVWSVNSYQRGLMPLRRAFVKPNLKISELRAEGQKFPAVDIYDPTVD